MGLREGAAMIHDDFAFEPVRGLPERLPPGEIILWQGRPDAWALARDALNMSWVGAYFAALALWRLATMIETSGPGPALASATTFVLLGGVVCALLWLVAFAQARATVYTLTNRRIAMRIGAALSLTLNLPYTQVRSADLDRRRGGQGTIAFDTASDTRLSYLVCWPHVRPWHLRIPQPSLRCIPDAAGVARVFAEAAEARLAEPQIARTAAAAVAAE